MKTCDFSQSFITYTTKNRFNDARIQIDAKCTILDGGKTEDYYLTSSCKAEVVGGKDCLFKKNNYDWRMVYSSNGALMMIHNYANAKHNKVTVSNRNWFDDISFHIAMTEGEMLTGREIMRATFSKLKLNGRIETDRMILEFPIKTINIYEDNYQVDTGPVLLPDSSLKERNIIKCFNLAFVAYNNPNGAYFIIQKPTKIGMTKRANHYSEIIKRATRNEVICQKEKKDVIGG